MVVIGLNGSKMTAYTWLKKSVRSQMLAGLGIR